MLRSSVKSVAAILRLQVCRVSGAALAYLARRKSRRSIALPGPEPTSERCSRHTNMRSFRGKWRLYQTGRNGRERDARAFQQRNRKRRILRQYGQLELQCAATHAEAQQRSADAPRELQLRQIARLVVESAGTGRPIQLPQAVWNFALRYQAQLRFQLHLRTSVYQRVPDQEPARRWLGDLRYYALFHRAAGYVCQLRGQRFDGGSEQRRQWRQHRSSRRGSRKSADQSRPTEWKAVFQHLAVQPERARYAGHFVAQVLLQPGNGELQHRPSKADPAFRIDENRAPLRDFQHIQPYAVFR